MYVLLHVLYEYIIFRIVIYYALYATASFIL